MGVKQPQEVYIGTRDFVLIVEKDWVWEYGLGMSEVLRLHARLKDDLEKVELHRAAWAVLDMLLAEHSTNALRDMGFVLELMPAAAEALSADHLLRVRFHGGCCSDVTGWAVDAKAFRSALRDGYDGVMHDNPDLELDAHDVGALADSNLLCPRCGNFRAFHADGARAVYCNLPITSDGWSFSDADVSESDLPDGSVVMCDECGYCGDSDGFLVS